MKKLESRSDRDDAWTNQDTRILCMAVIAVRWPLFPSTPLTVPGKDEQSRTADASQDK